jgi:hypothetical protein
MDWNDVNRELQNRVSDPGARYMFGLMYERILDLTKQVDANNEILLALVDSMQNMVGLSEAVDGRMRELHKMITGREAGVSVESVPLTNDDIN